MPKVVLKRFIRVSPGDLNLVREHLKDHIRLTRGEPGCLVFNVSQRKTDSSIFDVHEEFVDANSFAVHQARVRNSRWGKVTKNVERHYETTGKDC